MVPVTGTETETGVRALRCPLPALRFPLSAISCQLIKQLQERHEHRERVGRARHRHTNVSLQLINPSVLAHTLAVPVVFDLRAADLVLLGALPVVGMAFASAIILDALVEISQKKGDRRP